MSSNKDDDNHINHSLSPPPLTTPKPNYSSTSTSHILSPHLQPCSQHKQMLSPHTKQNIREKMWEKQRLNRVYRLEFDEKNNGYELRMTPVCRNHAHSGVIHNHPHYNDRLNNMPTPQHHTKDQTSPHQPL